MALLRPIDYIYQAFRKCGQMRAGYTPPIELLIDGLNEWWLMFDGFNARRTMQYTTPDFIYPITGPGTAALATGQVLGMGYTLGQPFTFDGTTTNGSPLITANSTQGLELNQAISGTGIPANTRIAAIVPNVSVTISHNATVSASNTFTLSPDLNGPRPENIVRANLYMSSVSPTQPTRIKLSLIDADQWASISVLKLAPINVTCVAYYEARFPFGVLWVWPPLNGNSLEIFTWGFLTPPGPSQPPTLLLPWSAPSGYADVVVWGLAERLWPMCSKDMMVNKVTHQWICGKSLAARKLVMDVNAPHPVLGNDFAGARGGSSGACDLDLILTGEPY